MLKNDLKNDIEKTLQAHCPEPPEGFAERMDNKAISLIQKKHNQNVNKGTSRFRLPVLVTAAMLALCFVTAATRDLINRPDEIRARETTTPLVTAMSEGHGEVTEGEGLSQEAIERLESEYPGLINELKPINLSSEKQGVRFDLISAVVKDQDLYIVYSIQDLESDRVGGIMTRTLYNDNMGGIAKDEKTIPLSYDEAKHKVTHLKQLGKYSFADTKNQIISMSFEDLGIIEWSSFDLNPKLEQYGKTVDKGMTPPSDTTVRGGELGDVVSLEKLTTTEFSEILDYTQPLDETLIGPVKLTGIGWIDNKLHVQFHNTDVSNAKVGESQYPSWTIDFYADNKSLNYNTLAWGCDPETGNPSWNEYVCDITPDEANKTSFKASVMHTTKTLEAKWEFQVPVDSILAGAREDTAAVEDVPALMNAGSEDASEEGITSALWLFLGHWYRGDALYMLNLCADEWKKDNPDPEQVVRELLDSGRPRGLTVNGISGKNGDPVRTADVTIQWYAEDGRYTYSRHNVDVMLQRLQQYYLVDPEGFRTGVSSDPVAEDELYPITEEAMIRNTISAHIPEVSYDEMIPISGISTEKHGLRMEAVSGCVKGDKAYILCMMDDVEGKYDGLELHVTTERNEDGNNTVNCPRVYWNKDENRSVWLYEVEQPGLLKAENGTVDVKMNWVSVTDKKEFDLIPFLKEYGKDAVWTAQPDQYLKLSEMQYPDVEKVLDYTKPLDIPLWEGVKLTGIGWIDGQLHIQVNNTWDGTPVTVNIYTPVEHQYYRPLEWIDDKNYDSTWQEFVLDVKPEEIEQSTLTVDITKTRASWDEPWEVQVPVNMIRAEAGDDPAANIQNESDEQIKATLWAFFSSWVGQNTEYMLDVCADEWKKDRLDPKQAIQKIMGYWGQPGGYIINGISGKDNDPVRTVDLTVQWKTEDGGYSYNRHEIALRLQRVTPAMEAYRIDPVGFNTGIDVETVPGKELVLLTEEEIIRKEVGYPDLSYDDFIPLNLSVEKQGIQMKVVSGCVKGQDLYVLCSFQDLEGRYDGLDMELVQWYRDEFPRMDYSRPYSNYAENKSFWLFHTEEFAQYQAEDGTIALAIDLVKFENDTSVDLIPFLEKYGKKSDGVNAPENARAFGDKESTESLKVLDYTNPLDVSLTETAKLTGIGWIDNQLHVQMHTGAETIQTKSGTGFSATQVHAYDPISSLSSQVVEWDDSGDWFPEWYDYALDIKPEEVEQRWLVAEVREVKGTVEDNWEIQVPVNKLMKETGAEPVSREAKQPSAADEHILRECFENIYPGVSYDEMIPISGLSAEDQGIRMDVVSGCIKENKASILLSVKDAENRYADGLNLNLSGNSVTEDSYMGKIVRLCNKVDENQSFWIYEVENLKDDPDSNGDLTVEINQIGISEDKNIDLIPFLKEYGRETEGIEPPELHPAFSKTSYPDMKILDYTQPLNIPLMENVKLTGIGWIDNRLHTQIRFTADPIRTSDGIGHIGAGVNVYNSVTNDVAWPAGWDDNGDEFPDWMEAVMDVKPENLEQLTLTADVWENKEIAEGNWEIQIPVNRLLPETGAESLAPETEEAEPATLSNEGEVFLEYAYPGLLNELKPVNLSSVQQGIRADVISALIKDQKVYVVYSLQDLEGDRIKENPMIWYSDNLGGVGSETMRLGFSEVNDHKITYLKTYDLSEPVQEDGRLVIKLDGLGTEEETTINLLPLLKKYGDTVEGVNKPEDLWVEPYDLRTSTAVASSKYPKILDYKHPLEESLKGAISLTGIGWIDNRLHVQIHNTDETAITIGNTVYPSWMISPSGSIRDGKDSRSYEYDTLSWDPVGKWQAAWQEYAWEITPDQVDQLELGATISHYNKIVDARWELDIPMASILADTEVKPAVQEAETEKTEMARGTLSLEEKIERTIEEYWPGIAKELKPMNLSREKQGIRLDVTSALVKGNVSWFVFTLQDLEGDRINEALYGYLDLYDARSVLDESVISTCWLVDFNQAEHKITYIVRNEYSDPYLLDYKDFAVGIRDICVAQESKLDLLPFIREYGEVLDGTEVPENVRCIHEMIGETKGEESWKVLNHTNPPDVELDKDIYLTGAGWIDDQLHLRLANQNKSTVKVGSKSYIQVMYSVETAVPTTDILFWDINDQTEYIFNIHREEMDEMEVSIHMTEILDVVKDYWEVRIPLEEVLAEDEDAATQETAAPEV